MGPFWIEPLCIVLSPVNEELQFICGKEVRTYEKIKVHTHINKGIPLRWIPGQLRHQRLQTKWPSSTPWQIWKFLITYGNEPWYFSALVCLLITESQNTLTWSLTHLYRKAIERVKTWERRRWGWVLFSSTFFFFNQCPHLLFVTFYNVEDVRRPKAPTGGGDLHKGHDTLECVGLPYLFSLLMAVPLPTSILCASLSKEIHALFKI